jgi:hypothetical protein
MVIITPEKYSEDLIALGFNESIVTARSEFPDIFIEVAQPENDALMNLLIVLKKPTPSLLRKAAQCITFLK